MNIELLCNKIYLQKEVKEQVLRFSNGFDFALVNSLLEDFRQYEKMSESLTNLQERLGDDSDGFKVLACMLKASSDVYDIYKLKGISDDIYFATMKCYTRFIKETQIMTNKLCFDRFWWTTRQAGCHLFRIGELEYEMRPDNGKVVIDIHIPSDAVFTPSMVDNSINVAKEFFRKYYPELVDLEFYCHSWLLDKQLQTMLNEDSNIVNFQKRFEIYDDGEIDNSFIGWIFHTTTNDYQSLPEDTSLQRNVKKHILSGGIIRSSHGKLSAKI